MPRLRISQRAIGSLLVTALALAAGTGLAACVGGGAAAAATGAKDPPVNQWDTVATTNTPPLSQAEYLARAQQGVAQFSRWYDTKRGWYLEYLKDHTKMPLASLWGSVSTLEVLSEVAIASPSAANTAAVESFADYYRHYWNPYLKPAPGYSPSPGPHAKTQETWYDDAGWIGLAFLDADEGIGSSRYLADAERAFHFIVAGGWDRRAGGGVWWNTDYKLRSGEALAADTDLAARLYQTTRQATYLQWAKQMMAWANKHLSEKHNGVYSTTSDVPYESYTYTVQSGGTHPGGGFVNGVGTPVGKAPKCPKKGKCICRVVSGHKLCAAGGGGGSFGGHPPPSGINPLDPKNEVPMPNDGIGALLAAMTTLCQATGDRSYCGEAETYAANILKWLEPFDDGSEYDAILVRGFITLYAEDHKERWYHVATSMATVIIKNAESAPGVYLNGWDGEKSTPGAVPNMLRTDASSLEVFADLATVPAPG